MKVLIADDDALSRRVLQTNLEKWGYDVVLAENGNEAWEILSQDNAPGIAILDWVMPGMDGIQLCQAVRQLDNDTFTYVILLSAMSHSEDIAMALDSGADDYVVKPCNPLVFKARIRAAERVVNLELFLKRKIRELEQAHAEKEELKNQMAVFQQS